MVQEIAGKAGLYIKESRNSEGNVFSGHRISLGQSANEFVSCDPFMEHVSQNVHIVEVGSAVVVQEPPHGGRVAGHRYHGSHFKCCEVTHESASPTTVKAQIRNEVVSSQGDTRNLIDVRTGCRIEVESTHRDGK